MNTNRKGFTLVEIMIVVAIIGILAAIAIPNFLRSRKESQKNSCIANMKQIEGAIEQYMLAGNAAAPATVAALCVAGDTGYMKSEPHCPAGAAATVYAIPVSPARVVCPNIATSADHVLN
ncbi:MAG: prepilin-type N-terminal cleavage/methylation domain-containing protein [bacterium]